MMIAAISLLVIGLLVAIDQLIKSVMIVWLKPMDTHAVFPGFFQFRYVENTGAAFGMLKDSRWFFIAFTSIIILIALYMLVTKKIKNGFVQICAVMIIAGGIGNLIDRVFRTYVVDYIEFQFMNFAVFNFADSLVSVGASLLIGYLLFDIYRDNKKNKLQRSQSSGERS